MTADLQQFRYDNLLRRVGNIIGPGSKVKEVLSELFPVIDVERIPGELLWLAGWRVSMGGFDFTSEVAESPRGEIFNPVDSGKLMVVSSVVFSASGGGTVKWTTTNVLFPNVVGSEKLRDTRAGFGPKPSGLIRTLSAAGSTVGTNTVFTTAQNSVQLHDENGVAILFPGTGLEFGLTTLNSRLAVSFNWRERLFEPSELTGI